MFKKLQELLDSGAVSSEVATALDAEIGTALKELREEAKNWREKYQQINATFDEVKTAKEALEAQLGDIDKKIEEAKAEGKAELVKQLEATKAEQEQLKGNLERIENENKRLKIETAVTEKLTGLNPVDLEAVKTLVSLNADLSDTGVVLKLGDETLDLEKGLEKFRELKPTLFKAEGNGGSGNTNSQTPATGLNRSKMTAEQKAEYISQHGQDSYLKLPE